MLHADILHKLYSYSDKRIYTLNSMCGAYSQFTDSSALAHRFKAKPTYGRMSKRYNIRPSQRIPIITNTDPTSIILASWGIRPFYDKTGKLFFINARSDSLEKPFWKKLMQEQRRLVLADGFYEWQKPVAGSHTKIPYRFELLQREPFAFAGLWQIETKTNGEEEIHCVIITTEPNSLVSSVHNRMPAILSPEAETTWLNPDTDVDQALTLLTPYPSDKMHAYPISTLVNVPGNDTEDILNPALNSQ